MKREIAAPCPRLPPERPTWYARVAKRWVVLIGPPRVRTWTILKSAKVKTVEKRMTTASTGLIRGSVTCQKRPQELAPSTSAASRYSRGTVISPASTTIAKKGSPRQTLTVMTADMAYADCPSQLGPGALIRCSRMAVQLTTL